MLLPLLSARVQRMVERSTGIALGDVLVDQSPAAGAAARAIGARAFTSKGAVHAPPASLGGSSRPSEALLAHELVHVAQQRVLGSARPREGTAAGQALELQAVRVQRAVEAGSSVPRSSPTQALREARPTPRGASAAASGGHPTVQRAPSEDAAAGSRGADPAAPPWLGSLGSTSGSAGAGGTGSRGPADGELDEMVRQIYPRLRAMLTAELRLDRERTGRVTDLRR